MPRRRNNWPTPPDPLYNSDYEPPANPNPEPKPENSGGNLFGEIINRVFNNTSQTTADAANRARITLPAQIARRTANQIAQNASSNLQRAARRAQPRLGQRPWESGEMGQFSEAVASGQISPLPPVGPQGNPELDALRAEIMSLLSKPDTPGYWESPYSQDYLDALGGRLTQAGLDSQAGFNAANQDLSQVYAQALAGRNQANQDFTGQLASGLANIGIDLPATQANQQAAADFDYLTQVAQQNLATDQAFGTKLGELYANQGQHLGAQAREGLLTPKEWVPPQSGLSDADRLRAQFLMDDYFSKQGASQSQDELDYLSKYLEDAEENIQHLNPEFVQQLAGVGDPRLREAITEFYDLAGGDVPGALELAQEQMNRENVTTPPLPADPNKSFFGNIVNRLIPPGMLQSGMRAREDEQIAKVIEFLRGVSPTYGGVITQQTLNNRTNTNIPFNAR